MYQVGKALSVLVNVLAAISAVAAALMMLHITLDVILKELFNFPLPATFTIVSNYYMPAVVFLPLALAEKRQVHISVEVLVQFLRPRMQRMLAVLTWLIAAGIFCILMYQSWLDSLDKTTFGTFIMEQDYKVPIWPTFFLLPVGFLAIVAVLVYRVAVAVSGSKDGLGGTEHDAFRDHLAE